MTLFSKTMLTTTATTPKTTGLIFESTQQLHQTYIHEALFTNNGRNTNITMLNTEIKYDS